MTKIEDSDLRRKVIEELDCEPSVDAAQIGVAVKDGIVTLTGTVLTYPERKNAEKVASRVAGVRAVVGDLESSYSAPPHETPRRDYLLVPTTGAAHRPCQSGFRWHHLDYRGRVRAAAGR